VSSDGVVSSDRLGVIDVGCVSSDRQMGVCVRERESSDRLMCVRERQSSDRLGVIDFGVLELIRVSVDPGFRLKIVEPVSRVRVGSVQVFHKVVLD